MQIEEWLRLFIGQIANTPLLEWVAVSFSMASVLLSRANSVWLYPTGIVGTAIFTYLFIRPDTGLYAEGLLNLYYFFMSIYGWVHWIRRKNGTPLAITMNNRKDWTITTFIVLAGWAFLFLALSAYTNSDVPVWDAWVSATAWAGMWLLARRKVENWILLNISNISAIPLLVYKKMPLTALLTLFLFIVAIFGFINWRKIYLRKKNTSRV